MTEHIAYMREQRTGRGYWVLAECNGQMFRQHSWESYEAAEAKIRGDVRRVFQCEDAE